MSETKPTASAGDKPTASAPRTTIDSLRLTTGNEPAAELEGPNAFLHAWFQLFKTAQIHSLENQALRRPLQNYLTVSARIIGREGRISLQSKDRALFLNSVKLKMTTEEYEQAFDVFEFFEERGMGGFLQEAVLDADGVRTLLRILIYAPAADRKFAALDAALKAAALPFRINKTLGAGRRSSAEVVLERRGYTFLTYSKLVVLFRSLLAEDKPNPSRRQFLSKKITRTVHALVDICMEDDHTFLGVAAVKSGEAYAPHHASNVAVLSISLGEKLGLSKVELADLGLAALFHDIGLASAAPSLLEKRGALDADEKSALEQTPLKGVEFLLGERDLTRSLLSRMVVAYEHRRHTDGSGYRRATGQPDLFSRIVSIACAYDAMTTDRPWRKAFLPDEALGQLLSLAGKGFDPVLVKVFVNALGLYPVGTLVRLTTGELGLVVYGGGEAERATHPIVALLGPDGRPSRTVDLAATDAAGAYLAGIVRSEDPAKFGLQPAGLLAKSPGV